MTIHSTDTDTLEALAFLNPGTQIVRHDHNGVEIRELHIGDDVWTSRGGAA